MKTLLKYLTAAAAAAGLAAGSAYAVPTLTFTNGITTVAIHDNVLGEDTNLTAGVVDWSGVVGDWRLASGLGQALPVLGTSFSPNIDLNFAGTSDVLGSKLYITFEGTGYSYSGSLLDVLSVTAASGGTVEDKVFIDGSIWVTGMGPFGSGNWSQLSGTVTLVPTDVLAIQVILTSNGSAGTISGDKNILAVPDGGTTALLLGLGFLGVGFVARRFKSVKA